eukprot:gene19536-6736_t
MQHESSPTREQLSPSPQNFINAHFGDHITPRKSE